MASHLSLRECITLACMLEATAPKPGNVHRGADFDDVAFPDFLASAVVIAEPLAAGEAIGVGRRVLGAVQATHAIGVGNTNLGIILLLAPLAAVPRDMPLRAGVAEVLKGLTAADSHDVYEAIRLANPGGLGRAESMDVHDAPPADLLVAMTAGSARDSIARQYVTDFTDVLDDLLPELLRSREATGSLTAALIHTHLVRLAKHGDSLIRRKCGDLVDEQARRGAQLCLEAGEPHTEAYFAAVADYDFWLRADGRKRNPGTTADLLAAALFAGLRDGLLSPPWR